MKKILSLLTLLVAIVTGANAAGYTPTDDEVIILNDVYDASKTDAGYSTHDAIAWGGTASTNSKKAGDPNNNGEKSKENLPCFSVKGNGKGKNITVSVSGVQKIIIYHEEHSSRYIELLNGGKDGELIGNGVPSTTFTEVELDASTDYSIFLHGTGNGSDDQDINVYAIKLIPGTPAPVGGATIVTQPQDAVYVNGTADYPNLSVEATATAGEITYEWFIQLNNEWMSLYDMQLQTAGTSTLSGAEAIAYLKAIIPGGVIPAGEYSFKCVVTNEGIGKDTRVAKITVKNKSEKCQLISIQFSNRAYGSIEEPTPAGEDAEANPIEAKDGKITVPYMAGEEEPLLIADMVEFSENATLSYDDDTKAITVTAEDGTTQAKYNIVYQAITPLTVTADVAADFTEVPSWVYNPYGWSEDKGLKFAKAVNSDPTETQEMNYRISKGNTRQYYFIGAAESIGLTAIGTIRKVNVYVNGEEILKSVNNDEIGEIMLSTGGNNMVCIESAQTGGDGGFGSYSIKASATAEIPSVTLNSEGFATFSFTKAVKVAEGTTATAYYAAGLQGNKLIIRETGTIPAEQGAIIYGAPGTVVNFVESAEDIQLSNLLRPTSTANGVVPVPSTSDAAFISNALTLDGSTFKTFTGTKFNANKAYILKSDIVNDTKSLEIVFDGQATAVDAVAEAAEAEAAPVKVIKGGKLYIGNYNVAGQQVK